MKELARRKKSLDRFLDEKFRLQTEFIKDDSPFISVLCTRRAGKSYGAGLKLFRKALEVPGSTCLYVALTRSSAKNIMWDDVIKTINSKLKLSCTFNESELVVRLPNKSKIKLIGADASKRDMEKVLGGKYPLVVIDEGGSYKIDLNTFIYENLFPAVADYNGSIAIIGTPTRFINCFFHKATDGRIGGWSRHEWETEDNPHMVKMWKLQLQHLRRKDPDIEDKAHFKRMYKRQWVTDTTNIIYKFDKSRNWVHKLPKLPNGEEYKNLLAIDLGWEDATAFSIISFSDYDGRMYIRDQFKKSHMDLTDVANKVKEYYMKKYDIFLYVVDNATKQAVEEMKNRHQIPFIPAEKTGKEEFISMMNADFTAGNIQLVGNTSEYETEMGSLVWDEDALFSGKRVEDPNCDNHLCDTGLYGWRKARNYLPKARPQKESDIDSWERKQLEKYEREKFEQVQSSSTFDDAMDSEDEWLFGT